MLTPLKSLSFVFVILSKKSAAMFTLDRPRRQNNYFLLEYLYVTPACTGFLNPRGQNLNC